VWQVELAETNASFLEHARAGRIHAIALVVDDLAHAALHNLDRAQETRARVAVDYCVCADAVAACLEKRVLLCVEAQAV